jgi:hypothetical protein
VISTLARGSSALTRVAPCAGGRELPCTGTAWALADAFVLAGFFLTFFLTLLPSRVLREGLSRDIMLSLAPGSSFMLQAIAACCTLSI